jgi:hypothetical protein
MKTHRALLAGLVVVLVACSQPLTVEQRVIAVIRQMEEKIEAGERRDFMTHIAEDFSGRDGRMNRDQVRALVVFQLRRFERLQAQLFPITVTETGPDRATAEFRALVTGGPGWIPERGQVYDFSTSWRLIDDEWLLDGADWEPVPLDEVLENLPAPSID